MLALEEAVQGVDGVKDVRSVAAEGSATVILQLLLGSDTRQAFSDVKSVVGRISSFPAEAERPNVRLISTRRQVISARALRRRRRDHPSYRRKSHTRRPAP